jgi:hypothetical protein
MKYDPVEDDPGMMIHNMKIAAQGENAFPYFVGKGHDKPEPEPAPSVAEGQYEGAGGYQYEVSADGGIKIVGAPKDRGVGVTLRAGHPAHEAIMAELMESQPVDDLRSEESDTMDTMLADQETRAEEGRMMAGGVREGEGRSGEEMAKKGNQVKMGADAQAAFDRVKSKNEA